MTFYAKPGEVELAVATITKEVVPQYIELPHFLGYVVLLSEAHGHAAITGRRQVTVMSFWHTGLGGSGEIADRFVTEVNRVAGTNPSRTNFDLVKAMWRGSHGQELAEFP